ncbi:NIPSNAP family protein [Erwinia sp. TH29]|uniref:NIPSNAP family protein n=1 Tax=unclassified Erwinia TaxID=2622719 RepID=UPI0019124D61|nr:NIPSNAP family protein [Bacillus sp. TH86]MBK5316444.1 NIPSNAP family protein [Erwinia sp. TH79]MBK5321947.1 NIPSNAP family protein [Bacillus sp. TH59]MBK5336897.1 NIPSNAP family protein [Bacillus sp. TH57]MBK5421304.1 NIPSNAP family protein [Erwinia sp. TH29]
MITCHVRYVIDPYQIPAFESYSRHWIRVVNRMGGNHHGYFLPAEGANNIAYCLFCSGQLIPDTTLSFSSARAGASPPLN